MTMPKFTSVQQQTLSSTILDRLRDAIITGQLKPGDRLVQSHLADQFGVSRAPLREALHKLEEEGFVRHTPYKGTVVKPLTRRDVAELRSLRNTIEEFAGKLLMRNLTDEDVHEINQIYERMRIAADECDNVGVDREDLALHTKICELSGHRLLLEVWNLYANRFRQVLTFCNRVNRDLHQIVNQHEPLIRALETRDEELLHDFYENRGTDLTPYLPEDWPQDIDDPPGSKHPNGYSAKW